MAITGAQIATDAMFQAGVLGQDQATGAADADVQLVLRRLNRMLDSWSNERLMIYAIETETLALTPNVATYTSAGFLSGRPVTIEAMYVHYAGVDYLIEFIDNVQYASIGIKNIAAIPQFCYINTGIPNIEFTFFPLPSANMTATVYVRQLLSAPVTVSTSLVMPPGYEKAIVDNLAVDICPSFEREPTQAMLKSAQESRAVLKVNNYVPSVSTTGFESDLWWGLANGYKWW